MKKLPANPSKYIPFIRQHGLSLVELMISITVGLLLLTGLSLLIVQQSSSRSELEKSSRQIENGRYAMEVLRNDIEHAGFYSDYSPPSTAIYKDPDPDPCDFTTANLGWNNSSFATPTIPLPLYGYYGPGTLTDPTTPTHCLDHYKANTAVLVIRRTDTIATGTTSLQASQCTTDPAPFVLGTTGFTLRERHCSDTIPATRRAYIVRIYYVSTCDVCGSDTIPTLKMIENGAAATPLVEGIENMQFDYGLDHPVNPDGAPHCYFSNPSDPLAAQRATCNAATGIATNKWDDAIRNWSNVMTVRVNLLARNNDPTVGYADNKKYSLGSVTVLPTDIPASDKAYKRHAYSELVRVINPSSRREP